MKKYLVNIVFLFVCVSSYSQTVNILPASYFAGGVSVAQKGEWQGFHNPALLGACDRYEIATVYENRFGMKELSTQSLSFALPTSLISVGASISHFGYAGYSEMLAGISFARSFDNYFTMGVQFDYYSVSFSNSVGNKGVVVPQIGFLSEVTSDFYVGFNAFNPTHQQLKYQEIIKDIPCLLSLGVQYNFSGTFQWVCQLDKEVSSDLIWRTGFEYQPVPALVVRLGGYGAPFSPTLGCGVRLGGLFFDVNFERHPVLGITSVGALRYNF